MSWHTLAKRKRRELARELAWWYMENSPTIYLLTYIYTFLTCFSVPRFGARGSQLFLQAHLSFAIVLQCTPNLPPSGSRTEFLQFKESAHRIGGLPGGLFIYRGVHSCKDVFHLSSFLLIRWPPSLMLRLVDKLQHIFHSGHSSYSVLCKLCNRWVRSVMPTSLRSSASWIVLILFSWAFVKAQVSLANLVQAVPLN